MVNCEPLEAYRQLEEAELVGCWAHVRRKFFEAPRKQADKSSLGAKGLAYCDQLFSLERDWEALPADERLRKRQEHLQPLINGRLLCLVPPSVSFIGFKTRKGN
ncbi:TPA: transposase [Streptococcus pneumoniae]|nr:transposase [Streptococcus pneumoniae]